MAGDGDVKVLKVGLKVSRNIAHEWGLSSTQYAALLDCDVSMLEHSTTGTLPDLNDSEVASVLQRISHMFSIYRSLRLLFQFQEEASAWLRKPNSEFDGRTALSMLLQPGIEGVIRVRWYLQDVSEHLA